MAGNKRQGQGQGSGQGTGRGSGAGQGMGGGAGAGQGTGRGGRGRMGGRALGPEGDCLCPQCGARALHQRGIPCLEQKCPNCGTAMIRE